MKILSFSLMMSLTLTLLTVGIVMAITIPVQPAEGEKFYCGPDVGKCPTKKSDCEAVAGKGECKKIKIDLPE